MDAGEELGGGFVGGVLGDEFAGEGAFENGLAKGFGAFEGCVDLSLVLLDGGELFIEDTDDFLLFGEGTEGNWSYR